jgi:hypothetical protein
VVTLTLLALGAFAALAFWLRKSIRSRSGNRQKETVRRAAAKQLLEQDRLDCLELERSLRGGLSGRGDDKTAEPARPPHR